MQNKKINFRVPVNSGLASRVLARDEDT